MFRMNGKNRKKASKEKNLNQVGKISENKQKYQEDFNEVILNDLVPEEKRNDFGLESIEEPKSKKSSKIKLNLGLGGKKSASKDKKSSSNSKDEPNKKTKQSKHSSKIDKTKKESPKESNKKDNKDKISNKNPKKAIKKTTKKTKSLQSNDKEIKEEVSHPIEQSSKSSKKTNTGFKKKRVKQPSKESDSEIKRNVDESYTTEDNFDAVNFRTVEAVEVVEDVPMEIDLEDKQQRTNAEQQAKNRLGNLVWSEDKFPKK